MNGYEMNYDVNSSNFKKERSLDKFDKKIMLSSTEVYADSGCC